MKQMINEALRLISEIETLTGQVPPEGQDFAFMAKGKAQRVRGNIVRSGEVRLREIHFLNSLIVGLKRWIES